MLSKQEFKVMFFVVESPFIIFRSLYEKISKFLVKIAKDLDKVGKYSVTVSMAEKVLKIILLQDSGKISEV